MRIFWCMISILWPLIYSAYATAQDAPPELEPWVSQLPTGQFTLQSFARRTPDQPLLAGEQRTLCIETPQWQALVSELLHIDDRTLQQMQCRVAKREWAEQYAHPASLNARHPEHANSSAATTTSSTSIERTQTHIAIHSTMQGAHNRSDQEDAIPVYTETRFELTPNGLCPRIPL